MLLKQYARLKTVLCVLFLGLLSGFPAQHSYGFNLESITGKLQDIGRQIVGHTNQQTSGCGYHASGSGTSGDYRCDSTAAPGLAPPLDPDQPPPEPRQTHSSTGVISYDQSAFDQHGQDSSDTAEQEAQGDNVDLNQYDQEEPSQEFQDAMDRILAPLLNQNLPAAYLSNMQAVVERWGQGKTEQEIIDYNGPIDEVRNGDYYYLGVLIGPNSAITGN